MKSTSCSDVPPAKKLLSTPSGDLRARIDVRLPDESQVVAAARIKADEPMSYADAFAVALALDNRVEAWSQVGIRLVEERVAAQLGSDRLW